MQADLHVVQNAHLVEQTDVLEGTGDALLVDLGRLLAGDVLTVQDDVALGGTIHTGEHVEHRGLAGAVGTDEAVELAFFHLHVQLGHSLQTAEGDAQVGYFKQCHASRLLFLALRAVLLEVGRQFAEFRVCSDPVGHLRAPGHDLGLWLKIIITISTMAYTSMR